MESNIQQDLSKKRASNDKKQRINNKQLKERATGVLEKAKNSIGKEQRNTELKERAKTRGFREKATNNRT